MMRTVLEVILFLVPVQAHVWQHVGVGNHVSNAQDFSDTLVDKATKKVIDKLLDRVVEALPLHYGELDNTTLRKLGYRAMPTSHLSQISTCLSPHFANFHPHLPCPLGVQHRPIPKAEAAAAVLKGKARSGSAALAAQNPQIAEPKSTPASATVQEDSDFNREEWASGHCTVKEELDNAAVKLIRGVLPPELRGTLYRNVPGQQERGGTVFHHPFDGDGMIVSLRFTDGGVTMSNRFVRTEGWRAEQAADRMLYRGVFGTQKPGGLLANFFDIRLKNIANTHVVKLGDQLLALWEAAGPHALDPVTLDTHGLSSLGGVLKPGEAFSAHPRFDPGHHGAPCMVTFGVTAGPLSKIRLMEFATEGLQAGRLLHDRQDIFPGFAFLHDFAITPNWAIFLQNAVSMNPLPFIVGLKGAGQCVQSNPSGQAKWILIPRDSGTFAGQAPRILDGPDGFVFHHINAWEEGEDVVVDSIHYSDYPPMDPETNFLDIDFDDYPPSLLKRCHINLSGGGTKTTHLSERFAEFAMVNPYHEGLPARFAWSAASHRTDIGLQPLQAIMKLDLANGEHHLWSAAPHGFVNEPEMVPRPGAGAEDDGWVLSLVWNGSRRATNLVILNANDLSEQAVLELPLAIPNGLHGSWVPHFPGDKT